MLGSEGQIKDIREHPNKRITGNYLGGAHTMKVNSGLLPVEAQGAAMQGAQTITQEGARVALLPIRDHVHTLKSHPKARTPKPLAEQIPTTGFSHNPSLPEFPFRNPLLSPSPFIPPILVSLLTLRNHIYPISPSLGAFPPAAAHSVRSFCSRTDRSLPVKATKLGSRFKVAVRCSETVGYI